MLASAPPRILVADRDPATSQTVSWILREHGYDVLGAGGADGLAATMDDFPPDLLLLDTPFGDDEALRALARLKAHERWKDLPVIVTAGADGDELVERALATGAIDVVRKPFRAGELLARIGAHLRARTTLAATRRQLHGLQAELARAREEADAGRTMMEILREVGADLSSEEIYHLLVRRVARALDLYRCSVVIARPGDERAIVPAAFDDPALRNRPLELARYPEIRVALESGRPVLVPDVSVHPLFAGERERWREEGRVPRVRSVIALPFFVDRQQAGVVLLRRGDGEPPLDEGDVAFADAVVKAAVASIQRAHLLEVARADNARLAALAQTDPLTGVLNRRALMERLGGELDRARRYGHAVAVLMLDLDHFKQINDTLGHLVGDGVLRELGELLRGAVRTADFVARYGGEEFVLVLPETSAEGAVAFADRLREKVAHSIGVALFPAPRIATVEELLSAADTALYRAKADGRNRVHH
ncbi:MAG: diguanylate cyclase [Gemmatimonadaceae bacterium]|nr:diguanylate cyclase [Gemmatimonadaceae bacterium]